MKKLQVSWTVGRPMPSAEKVTLHISSSNVRSLTAAVPCEIRVQNHSRITNLYILRVSCTDPRVTCSITNVEVYVQNAAAIPIDVLIHDFSDWECTVVVHTNCIEQPTINVPLKVLCRKSRVLVPEIVPIPTLGLLKPGSSAKVGIDIATKSQHGWIEFDTLPATRCQVW